MDPKHRQRNVVGIVRSLTFPAMQHIGIETAQNVVVEHEVASIGDRIVAYILDALVLAGWVLLWFFLMGVLSGRGGPGTGWVIFMVLIVGMPYLFYHLVCEVTMDGQSIGKRARKIKVARLDGGQPGFGQYLLRWILRPIDGFYWLGLVVILINGRGQRLGDLAAGTTVVTLKQRLRLQDTLMTAVPADHRVTFPEVMRLNDAQAAMIREVLNTTKVKDRVRIIEEMAAKVRRAIGNEGSGLGSKEFLEIVLRDYVHLTGQQTTNP